MTGGTTSEPPRPEAPPPGPRRSARARSRRSSPRVNGARGDPTTVRRLAFVEIKARIHRLAPIMDVGRACFRAVRERLEQIG